MDVAASKELSVQYPLTSNLMLNLHRFQFLVHLDGTHTVVLRYLGDGHGGIALQDFVVIANLWQHIGNLVAKFHVLLADSEDGCLLLLVLQG